MKNLYYLLAATLLLLGGCKKDTVLNDQEPASHVLKCTTVPTSYCGTATTVNLITGQYTTIGSVTVVNDATNLYVTYSTEGSAWYLTQLHLYVGDANGIPKNWGGNPVVGAYPYSYTFCAPYGKSYTFSIPLANLPNCSVISAHAAVVKKYGNSICNSSTAWGQGTRFGCNSWGMYFNVCKQSCLPTGEGCAYGAPYWFNGYQTWPTPSVTVAGYTYTQAEGYELGRFYNGTDGYRDALFIMFQSASIKLSSNTVGRDASIWGDVTTIDTWLTGKGKISVSNAPAVPQEVLDAGYHVASWQDLNDCDSSN